MVKYFLIALTSFCFGTAIRGQNKIMLNASDATDTINKNIYGHFAEDLGRGIYGGFYVGEFNKTN